VTGVLGAIQFLTRIPIRMGAAAPHQRIVPWFPFVGALIGVGVGAVAVGLAELVPPSVAATTAVIAGLMITGAFHEDGLADVADAFGGGATRERRFEILKDSRHGTYGVAALCASIVLRVVAGASIATQAAMFAGFVAAHALGRTAAVPAMLVVPPATDAGLGADHARRLPIASTLLGVGSGLAIATLATGWWVLWLVGVATVATSATCLLAVRKIGGLVGDVLGAVEQVVECTVLVTITALSTRYGVWWG